MVSTIECGEFSQAVARFGYSAKAQQDHAFGLVRQQIEAEQAEGGGGSRAQAGFVDQPPVVGNAEMASRDALGVVGDDQHVFQAMLVEIVAIQADQQRSAHAQFSANGSGQWL